MLMVHRSVSTANLLLVATITVWIEKQSAPFHQMDACSYQHPPVVLTRSTMEVCDLVFYLTCCPNSASD